jgi:tRNA(fMet)-specific endonuclease VapC
MEQCAAATGRVVVAPVSLCLDTSTCVDLLRHHGGETAKVLGFFPASAAWISAVALSELAVGANTPPRAERQRAALMRLLDGLEVRAFDVRAAEVTGAVAARLNRAGRRIGPRDAMIGAHALAEGATLVTANPDEFRRIPGLQVVNSRSLG